MLRKCYIHSKDKIERGWFHQFYVHQDVTPPSITVHGDNGGQVTQLFAVIEDEEHKIKLVSAFQIQFADGEDWDAPVEKREWWLGSDTKRMVNFSTTGCELGLVEVEEAGNETTL